MDDFLIVLDINNTLISKLKRRVKPEAFSIKHHYLLKRDHTDVFVDFLHSHKLNYVIWSTAIAANIKNMLVYLEEIGYTNYLGYLDQEYCQKGKITEKIKALKSIKNLEVPSRIYKKELSKCILVDDSPDKAVEGQNYLKIGEIDLENEDTELIRIAFELDKFVGCKEECKIKKLIKEINI